MQHISDIVVTELSSKLARTLEQLKGQGHVSSIQMAFIAQRTSDLATWLACPHAPACFGHCEVNVRIAASREAFPTIRFLVEVQGVVYVFHGFATQTRTWNGAWISRSRKCALQSLRWRFVVHRRVVSYFGGDGTRH